MFFHKNYEKWLESLDGTPVDEIYDTQMEVELDPCGAHWAIHHMQSEIARLQAAIDAEQKLADMLGGLLLMKSGAKDCPGVNEWFKARGKEWPKQSALKTV